jgi:hypothetical protein
VAVNCCVPPVDTLGFAGVTAIDWSVATTVSIVEPLTAPKVAEMLVVPEIVAAAVARPVALTVATARFDDAQVTIDVRFRVLASA